MPDIFDEVDEDLRAERARRFARRWGWVFVAGAILIVAGVGAWEVMRRQAAAADTASATAYGAADVVTRPADGPVGTLSDQRREEAEKQFGALAGSAPQGYRDLALMREAALRATSGDVTGASQIWDQLAGDSAVDPVLRDLATLLWAQNQPAGTDLARVANRLAPLRAPGNAYHGLAEEALASAEFAAGKTDEARQTLKALTEDASVSENVRRRAALLEARLGA